MTISPESPSPIEVIVPRVTGSPESIALQGLQESMKVDRVIKSRAKGFVDIVNRRVRSQKKLPSTPESLLRLVVLYAGQIENSEENENDRDRMQQLLQCLVEKCTIRFMSTAQRSPERFPLLPICVGKSGEAIIDIVAVENMIAETLAPLLGPEHDDTGDPEMSTAEPRKSTPRQRTPRQVKGGQAGGERATHAKDPFKHVTREETGETSRKAVAEGLRRIDQFRGVDFSGLLGVDPRTSMANIDTARKKVRKALGISLETTGFGELARLKEFGMTLVELRRVGMVLGFDIVRTGEGILTRRDLPPISFVAMRKVGTHPEDQRQAEADALNGFCAIGKYLLDTQAPKR